MAATDTKRFVQKAWLGGMNTFSAEDSVENNEAFLLNNITLMERVQAVAKISGSKKFLQVTRDPLFVNTTTINNLFHFTKPNNVSTQIVTFSDPDGFHVAEFTAAGITEITPSGTPYGAPVTDFISFAGRMYFVTGENAVFKWDGVAVTYDRITMPLSFNPTLIEMYNSRAYYAGDSSDPIKVVFSRPNTPDIFTTPLADFVDVTDSLGDGIISLDVLGNNLVVFKKRSIHLIIGSPPREVREISAVGIGALSKDTVQKTQIGLIFLSELGVYVFTISGQLEKLSLNIEPDIQKSIQLSQNNLSSVYYKNVYYLFDQSATSLTIDRGVAFALDTIKAGALGITKLTNFHCKHNIVLSAFDANNDWLAVRDKSNTIIKLNNTEYPFFFESEANPKEDLESNIITHWEDMGDPTVIKSLRTLHFFTQKPLIDLEIIVEIFAYGKATKTTVEVSGSDSNLWSGPFVENSIWNEFNWEPNNAYHYRIIVPVGLDFERIRLLLNSKNTGEIFNLMSVEYHFVPRREV